jgi:lipoate-protein ligase A
MTSAETSSWRLIVSVPTYGAMNMAVDDAILDAVSEGKAPPTMRLYAWEPPCLSIGYAQPTADVDLERIELRGWDIVRRPTGGRAILHTDELTYAIAAHIETPHMKGGVLGSYRHLSKGLAAALDLLKLDFTIHPARQIPQEMLDDPVCFQVPSSYEITANGRKLIGSAQVRKRQGVLQHGSFPLSGDIARICEVLKFENEAARLEAAERVREQATTAVSVVDKSITWQDASQAFVDGFQNALGIRFEQGELNREECAKAADLVETRYGNPKWTVRR